MNQYGPNHVHVHETFWQLALGTKGLSKSLAESCLGLFQMLELGKVGHITVREEKHTKRDVTEV